MLKQCGNWKNDSFFWSFLVAVSFHLNHKTARDFPMKFNQITFILPNLHYSIKMNAWIFGRRIEPDLIESEAACFSIRMDNSCDLQPILKESEGRSVRIQKFHAHHSQNMRIEKCLKYTCIHKQCENSDNEFWQNKKSQRSKSRWKQQEAPKTVLWDRTLTWTLGRRP